MPTDHVMGTISNITNSSLITYFPAKFNFERKATQDTENLGAGLKGNFVQATENLGAGLKENFVQATENLGAGLIIDIVI